MIWPKKVKNTTYSIRINTDIIDKILDIDEKTNYHLKKKLEFIQGTVDVKYDSFTNDIWITVSRLADHPGYWKMVETVINNHIK